MTGSVVDRAFQIVEFLSTHADGVPLQHIADRMQMPKSGAHRMMAELVHIGIARQDPTTSHYVLTMKVLSFGLAFLASSGVVDLAQPILDRLATRSGELARLAIVGHDQLTWVAKAQGARSGLRYDPEMGQQPTLFCTASGLAWLATLDDHEALRIVTQQGFGRLTDFGPNAPRTVNAFLTKLGEVRKQGFAMVADSAELGTSAMAAAILHPKNGRALGTVSIAGPTIRLTHERAEELRDDLIAAVRELSMSSAASEFLTTTSRMALGKQATA
ncbi:IclR family transcriptional regulator [Mesorhizobium sp. AD1-1]|uniref:IclR family transcriptional regulator n=1 Tax=Mesorhizobium sp. AD1-1 TaxID=2876621 RepID=UPI001CCF9F45|nr:IclR family transcriptional regulator [Mesorhizobium sp. AD1-1]MBZ9719233.1 IclR family transcriptional regulator [Mesorhizobium sp. AD1-1]